jgi:peptidoglycan/xylan/chitin deacetylase (PgdA/CDA1 family)
LRDRLVLGYHAVSATWPAALAIEPERLGAQLEMLLERGYVGATFTEAVTAPPARKTLAVTFDDGYRSVLEHALPILSRHGLVATVFVPTDYMGRTGPLNWPVINQWIGGPHEHELTPMSWADLTLLVAAGWEVASHTRSHPYLTRLDDASLDAQLSEARRECEDQLGVRCRSVAYPYGDVNRRVADAARRAGYVAGAAMPARIHRGHQFRWPRVGVRQNDPARLFEVKMSPIARRRLDLRAGKMKLLPQWRLT